MLTLTFETVANAPLGEVWKVFSSADGFLKMHGGVGVDLIGEAPFVDDARWNFRFKLGPIGFRWRAHISTILPYHQGVLEASFVDVAEVSPFKLWRHRHRYVAKGDGTTICRDEVVLAWGPPVIGPIVEQLIIRPIVAAHFRDQHRVTAALFGPAALANP